MAIYLRMDGEAAVPSSSYGIKPCAYSDSAGANSDYGTFLLFRNLSYGCFSGCSGLDFTQIQEKESLQL
jgi:hypothetical protein